MTPQQLQCPLLQILFLAAFKNLIPITQIHPVCVYYDLDLREPLVGDVSDSGYKRRVGGNFSTDLR